LAQTVQPKSVNLGPGFWLVTGLLALLSAGAAAFWIVIPTPMGVEQAADTAGPTDILFKVLAVIGSALFIYVAGYIVYFSIVFRRPKNAPADTIGVQIHDAPVLEFWWTVLPAIIVLGLAIASVQILSKIYNTAGDVLTMEAIGYQFGFQFRYPNLPTPVADMHIPVGTPVTVHVTSRDVIHGFWIPEIRVKQDMVPGLINTVRFTPTKIGVYPIICTSYCGIAHGGMHSVVHVDSQQDFAKWFASVQPVNTQSAAGGGSASGAAVTLTQGSIAAGQTLFGQKCSACHSLGPYTQKIVGPGLGKIFDDPDHPKLVNGSEPSPQNIAMILKNGYQGDLGVMPSSQVNQISNADIANLVAYLVSLSKK
jgi:cytochrome c oxidase subunit 2